MQASQPSQAVIESRKAPRVLPSAGLGVRIPGLSLPLEIRDLSVGGFAIVAEKPFWRGMTHWFTFSMPSGVEVTLVAKAVHCRLLATGDVPRFVSGWQFMAGSAERTATAIGQLLHLAP
jgi:hypothetical protein